jgi:hypothetical protein
MSLAIQILAVFLFLFLLGTLALLSLEISKIKKELTTALQCLLEDSDKRSTIINILDEMMHKQLDLQRVNNALLNFHNSVMAEVEKSSTRKPKKVVENSKKPKKKASGKTLKAVATKAKSRKEVSTKKTKNIVAKKVRSNA